MEIFHHNTKTTPKDFFLYLGMIVTLYVSAGSLIKLLFDIINSLYPDSLNGGYYDPYSASLRFAIASLITVFPIYLLITNYLEKQVRIHDDKKDLWIRKWLIYLTLFLAGVAMIGDLIVLINTFLNGEITIRFILKVLAVIIVAGGVFGGYGYIVKVEKPKNKIINAFMAGSALVVIASIIGGFLVVGSPFTARKIRFDEQRVGDLQNIQWRVVNFWQNKRALPKNLGELTDSISGFTAPTDPATGEAYGYKIKGSLSFELCATFALPSQSNDSGMPYRSVPKMPMAIDTTGELQLISPLGDEGGNNWQHEEGQVCFERTIDPDFYRPNKPQI